MTEYRAPVIDIFTRERLDLHLVEPPELTPSEQSIHLADIAAEHWRSEAVERRARKMGLICISTVNVNGLEPGSEV